MDINKSQLFLLSTLPTYKLSTTGVSWDIQIYTYIFIYLIHVISSKRSETNLPLGGHPTHPPAQEPDAQEEAQDMQNFHKNWRIFCRIELLTNYSLCIINDAARRILIQKTSKIFWKYLNSRMRIYTERGKSQLITFYSKRDFTYMNV